MLLTYFLIYYWLICTAATLWIVVETPNPIKFGDLGAFGIICFSIVLAIFAALFSIVYIPARFIVSSTLYFSRN